MLRPLRQILRSFFLAFGLDVAVDRDIALHQELGDMGHDVVIRDTVSVAR